MFSLRSIIFRPRRSDNPLAKFFHADLELQRIADDLDSFDGSKEPNRCQKLIERLKKAQQRVMESVWVIVKNCIPEETRASRHYREKFPEELRGDHFSGQLWFATECLAAGSNVPNHLLESEELRPHARQILKVLATLRTKLRDQCFKDISTYPEDLIDTLRWFDYNWAEFEYSYISRMCPIKTPEELYQQHLTTILFSETTDLSLRERIITDDQMAAYDPVLMVAIPRLAIVYGLQQEDGVLDLSRDLSEIPVYFQPHVTILSDIKHSLGNLTEEHRQLLKQCLASSVSGVLQTDASVDQVVADTLQCLYLEISAIADQMITNNAKDLRQMLQHTFKMNQPCEPDDIIIITKSDEMGQITPRGNHPECAEPSTGGHSDTTGHLRTTSSEEHHVSETCEESDPISPTSRHEAPVWVPDSEVSTCASCRESFTLIRRKHHCRHCGKIFCQSCTAKTATLSFTKTRRPVRVCDRCHSVLLPAAPSTSRDT